MSVLAIYLAHPLPVLQLDPVEKEWIYSATCGRLSDLSQLLKQEPSLANKKVTSTLPPLPFTKAKVSKTTLICLHNIAVYILWLSG